MFVSCVGAIYRLGPSARADYEKALKFGTVRIVRLKVDMVGKEEAGKSCLGDSLMDEPFVIDRESTIGTAVKVLVRTVIGDHVSWKEVQGEEREKVI